MIKTRWNFRWGLAWISILVATLELGAALTLLSPTTHQFLVSQILLLACSLYHTTFLLFSCCFLLRQRVGRVHISTKGTSEQILPNSLKQKIDGNRI